MTWLLSSKIHEESNYPLNDMGMFNINCFWCSYTLLFLFTLNSIDSNKISKTFVSYHQNIIIELKLANTVLVLPYVRLTKNSIMACFSFICPLLLSKISIDRFHLPFIIISLIGNSQQWSSVVPLFFWQRR